MIGEKSRAGSILVATLLLSHLGCGGGPKVAYKELADEDPQIRADAALRLGQAKAKEAVDSLVAVLDDPDERVRVSAIRALGSIADPKAIPALVRLADDPLVSVKLALCQTMGQLADPGGVEAVSKLLYDPDTTVRMAATRALGNIPGPGSLDALLNVALKDEGERIRQHVIRVLGDRGARDAIPKVESALQSEAEVVRANAARVLGQLGDRSSAPALARALDDPYYKVRSLAAHSLRDVGAGDAEALRAMQVRLRTETHDMVKVDLAWNLARLGDRSHLGVLRELLIKGDPEDARAEAAMALGEVGEKSDLPLLEKALRDKKGLVRSQAKQAIDKLKKG